MRAEQNDELRRQLTAICDVLWHHARNMMADWQYLVPRPRRGRNLEERVAAWEHDRSVAAKEQFERLLADGYRRAVYVEELLGLSSPVDADRELSRLRDEASDLGRLFPSLRGQIAHELREEARAIDEAAAKHQADADAWNAAQGDIPWPSDEENNSCDVEDERTPGEV